MLAVALVELLDAAAGSDVTLTTREERMALRAHVDADLRLRGTRRERVAAAADDLRLRIILRMNAFFHVFPPRFAPKTGNRIQGSSAPPRF